MARLYDRIRIDCQTVRASIFASLFDEVDEVLYQRLDKIKAKKKFNFSDLDGVPVFVGDDVALYHSTLPKGTDISSVVASMAPPFKKFFIEFQKVPNHWDLYSWGILVSVKDDPNEIHQFEDDDGKPRWILNLETFIEKEKGHPIGPIAFYMAGLAEDGTWFQHAGGDLWWGGGPVEFDIKPAEDVAQSIGDNIAQLLFPALLTISFMHCNNVKFRTEYPSQKLSKKFRKKSGHDLIQYSILDIQPIRTILENVKSGKKTELRQALHICRGHFKTFTTDAPLFGRHIGTYWWTQQFRGSISSGIIIKDYRVHAPLEFGQAYREAGETPINAEREAPSTKEPDRSGRGLAAHNRTQNNIANMVRELGWLPMSPKADEPEYDLAWKTNGTYIVCEVKSLTAENEERQLRIAIGQVIRYRQKLNAAGYEPVTASIATEIEPQDHTWNELCEQENIILVWPSVAKRRFSDFINAFINKP